MNTQAGLYYFDGRLVDCGLLRRFHNALLQYGHSGGQHVSGSLCMLYRASHSTRDAGIENQPHASRLRNVMIWDGRLDNREELIAELRSDLRENRADVAIAMAAYERWGTDCFYKLIGDWSLSLWNEIEKSLILARDYMGTRPLYYGLTCEKVVWCTDLELLVLNAEGPSMLEDRYIAGYLAAYPETDITPYHTLKSVPAGAFVRLCEARATVHAYWALDPAKRVRYKTDAEYEEHFRYVFRQAVRRRLRSQAPILAELSGGLDSSSIVCMADDIIAKGEAQTPRLDTISFYNVQEPSGDERPYFTKVEEKRGRAGCHIQVGQIDPFAFLNPRKFHVLPGPLGDVQKIEADRLAHMRRQGNQELLSGIGGDEFMGGIPDPRPQLADLIMQFRFLRLTKQLMAWSMVKRTPWIQLLLQSAALLLPTFARAHFQKEAKIETWVDPRFAHRHRLSRLRLGPGRNMRFWLPSRIENFHTVVTMARLVSSALVRPQEEIEKRFPFLDRDLVEFVTSIPPDQLLRPGQRRSLMRRALANLVPPEILHRKSKWMSARFYMTALESHCAELDLILESLLSSQLHYINADGLKRTLSAARKGDATHITKVLRVLSLELWLRNLPSPLVTHGETRLDLPAQTNSLRSVALALDRFLRPDRFC